MHPQSATPAQLLGSLNAVEQRNAPALLYYVGDLRLLDRRRVAVVGRRDASAEGLRRAARLARELVAADVVVVSGLALGIDTAAHRAAIDAGGSTIAVLGNPLSTFYPAANRALQEEIYRCHLALSQFSEGVPPRPRNFPLRNRAMALMSHATVVVEANERSGTVSQAWEAIRLGRPLYLLRSLVESGLQWPKLLLEYGAEVFDNIEPLIEDLEFAGTAKFAEAAF